MNQEKKDSLDITIEIEKKSTKKECKNITSPFKRICKNCNRTIFYKNKDSYRGYLKSNFSNCNCWYEEIKCTYY